METQNRQQSTHLETLIRREDKSASFFEIMQYLICSREFDEKNLHLHVNPSLQFAASDITQIEFSTEKRDLEINIYTQMMGLTGIDGMLPQHYTELLLEQKNKNEDGFQDFLNIFENRSLQNLYHAWVKHRFQMGYSIGVTHQKSDPFSNALIGLSGYSLETLTDQLDQIPFSKDNIAFYSPLFFSKTKSGLGLEYLISTYFRWSVMIEPFQKETLPIPNENQCLMPTDSNPNGLNCQLGIDTLIGTTRESRNQKVKITIGPIKKDAFNNFTVNNSLINNLKKVVNLYIGEMLSFDIKLLLEPGVAQTASLGDNASALLGMNSWCHHRHLDQQKKSIVFTAER